MENLMLTPEGLFEEIAERARSEGALTKDAWDDLVETVLEDKREFMEIDEDEDVAQLAVGLKARFGEFSGSVEDM